MTLLPRVANQNIFHILDERIDDFKHLKKKPKIACFLIFRLYFPSHPSVNAASILKFNCSFN